MMRLQDAVWRLNAVKRYLVFCECRREKGSIFLACPDTVVRALREQKRELALSFPDAHQVVVYGELEAFTFVVERLLAGL